METVPACRVLWASWRLPGESGRRRDAESYAGGWARRALPLIPRGTSRAVAVQSIPPGSIQTGPMATAVRGFSLSHPNHTPPCAGSPYRAIHRGAIANSVDIARTARLAGMVTTRGLALGAETIRRTWGDSRSGRSDRLSVPVSRASGCLPVAIRAAGAYVQRWRLSRPTDAAAPSAACGRRGNRGRAREAQSCDSRVLADELAGLRRGDGSAAAEPVGNGMWTS